MILDTTQTKLTCERVQEIREKLINNKDNDKLTSLETAWHKIDPMPDQAIPYRELGASGSGVNPLFQMTQHLVWGHYPPPEILIAIAEVFNTYMESRGERNLEEMLMGQSKPKVGNYSAQHALDREHRFAKSYFFIEQGKKGKPLTEIATAYIQKYNLEDDPENLIKKLRRRGIINTRTE
jgi:hypothetical protein